MQLLKTRNKVVKRILIIGMMLLFASSPAWAGFDEGVRAYDSGDFATALHEMQILAEQGDAAAQYNLGIMYDNGQGVPEDDVEAVKWYTLAAKQGYASAQYNLGLMYRYGEGVPQDYAEAVKWYTLAVEQRYASAKNNLGVMYDHGRGVLQNYVLAHMWYNLAAAQLPPGVDRDSAVSNRGMVESKMTPEQVAEAQRLAREWEPKTE